VSIDPVQIGLGALLGFIGTGSLRWWQYRRDLWLGEVERFCDTLDQAAECATEYWLRNRVEVDPPEEGQELDEAGEKLEKSCLEVDLYEAKIMGFQTRLDGLSASISDRLIFADVKGLNKSMAGMSDALTGGDFRSASRDPDPDRAQLAQVYASDMIVDTRRSLARAMSLRGTAIYYWEMLQKKHIFRHFN